MKPLLSNAALSAIWQGNEKVAESVLDNAVSRLKQPIDQVKNESSSDRHDGGDQRYGKIPSKGG